MKIFNLKQTNWKKQHNLHWNSHIGKCVFPDIKVITVLHCIKYYVPRDEDELTVELKTWLWNLNHNNALLSVCVGSQLFSVFLIFKVR